MCVCINLFSGKKIEQRIIYLYLNSNTVQSYLIMCTTVQSNLIMCSNGNAIPSTVQLPWNFLSVEDFFFLIDNFCHAYPDLRKLFPVNG